MPSRNLVLLMGHLGKDAETQSTQGGKLVTKFSIATEQRWKDKASGEWKGETTWHDVVAWSLSDAVVQELVKGALVDVEGRIAKRSYENKEGRKVYITEIVAERVNFLRPANHSGPPPRGRQREQPPIDDSDLPF